MPYVSPAIARVCLHCRPPIYRNVNNIIDKEMIPKMEKANKTKGVYLYHPSMCLTWIINMFGIGRGQNRISPEAYCLGNTDCKQYEPITFQVLFHDVHEIILFFDNFKHSIYGEIYHFFILNKSRSNMYIKI